MEDRYIFINRIGIQYTIRQYLIPNINEYICNNFVINVGTLHGFII